MGHSHLKKDKKKKNINDVSQGATAAGEPLRLQPTSSEKEAVQQLASKDRQFLANMLQDMQRDMQRSSSENSLHRGLLPEATGSSSEAARDADDAYSQLSQQDSVHSSAAASRGSSLTSHVSHVASLNPSLASEDTIGIRGRLLARLPTKYGMPMKTPKHTMDLGLPAAAARPGQHVDMSKLQKLLLRIGEAYQQYGAALGYSLSGRDDDPVSATELRARLTSELHVTTNTSDMLLLFSKFDPGGVLVVDYGVVLSNARGVYANYAKKRATDDQIERLQATQNRLKEERAIKAEKRKRQKERRLQKMREEGKVGGAVQSVLTEKAIEEASVKLERDRAREQEQRAYLNSVVNPSRKDIDAVTKKLAIASFYYRAYHEQSAHRDPSTIRSNYENVSVLLDNYARSGVSCISKSDFHNLLNYGLLFSIREFGDEHGRAVEPFTARQLQIVDQRYRWDEAYSNAADGHNFQPIPTNVPALGAVSTVPVPVPAAVGGVGINDTTTNKHGNRESEANGGGGDVDVTGGGGESQHSQQSSGLQSMTTSTTTTAAVTASTNPNPNPNPFLFSINVAAFMKEFNALGSQYAQRLRRNDNIQSFLQAVSSPPTAGTNAGAVSSGAGSAVGLCAAAVAVAVRLPSEMPAAATTNTTTATSATSTVHSKSGAGSSSKSSHTPAAIGGTAPNADDAEAFIAMFRETVTAEINKSITGLSADGKPKRAVRAGASRVSDAAATSATSANTRSTGGTAAKKLVGGAGAARPRIQGQSQQQKSAVVRQKPQELRRSPTATTTTAVALTKDRHDNVTGDLPAERIEVSGSVGSVSGCDNPCGNGVTFSELADEVNNMEPIPDYSSPRTPSPPGTAPTVHEAMSMLLDGLGAPERPPPDGDRDGDGDDGNGDSDGDGDLDDVEELLDDQCS